MSKKSATQLNWVEFKIPQLTIQMSHNVPSPHQKILLSTEKIYSYFTAVWTIPGLNPITCQDNELSLSCEAGILKLESVMYGRKDTTTCPHHSVVAIDCESNEAPDIVKNQCDGSPSCSLKVDGSTLGADPCAAIYKYLEVSYICEG